MMAETEGKDAEAVVDELKDVADLKNLINVVNDSGSEEDKPFPMKVGSPAEGYEKNAVQQVLEDSILKPIQQGFQQHVTPHVDKLGENFQAQMDEHVKPQLDKVGEGFQSFRSSTTSAIGELGQNTKGAYDEHIAPKVMTIQSKSAETFDKISTSTREGVNATGTFIKDRASIAGAAINDTKTKHGKYFWDSAPGLINQEEKRLVIVVAYASFLSFAQVIFCSNLATGGLIFLAMLIGSPLVALSALSCVVAVNFLVHFGIVDSAMKIKMEDLGKNAVLVGAACAAYIQYSSSWLGWVCAIPFSIVLAPITILVHMHVTKTMLPNSSPLLMTYSLVMVVVLTSLVLWDEGWAELPSTDSSVQMSFWTFVSSVLNVLSAIFLVPGHWYSGLLILIGAVLFSRIIAAALLLGALTGNLLGLLFGVSSASLSAGYAGYQTALTAAALVYYLEPKWQNIKVILPAILLTSLVQAAVGAAFYTICNSAITLMIGFCLGTLAVLMLDTEQTFGLKQIPVDSITSPEEYLKTSAGGETSDVETPATEETPLLKEEEKSTTGSEETAEESTADL